MAANLVVPRKPRQGAVGNRIRFRQKIPELNSDLHALPRLKIETINQDTSFKEPLIGLSSARSLPPGIRFPVQCTR
jgi:hypothetical protein